ncbi:MAG: hypothetical protein IPH09_13120 [bacterium]|nr:hypothetical protein [bacterium]
MRIAYPCATLVTMALCGLWHGAGWNYVVWGVVHGVFLAFERLFVFGNRPIVMRPKLRGLRDRVRAVATAVVFLLLTLAWILFRSPTLGEAAVYFVRLFLAGGWVVQAKGLVVLAAGLAGLAIIETIAYRRRDEWVFRAAGRWRAAAYASAVLYLVLFGGGGGQVSFIYFQF